MAVKELSDYNPDGTNLGQDSDDLISFYGATPAVQSTLTAASAATTLSVSTTTALWGFSTSTQANAIVSLVNELRAVVVALGLAA